MLCDTRKKLPDIVPKLTSLASSLMGGYIFWKSHRRIRKLFYTYCLSVWLDTLTFN